MNARGFSILLFFLSVAGLPRLTAAAPRPAYRDPALWNTSRAAAAPESDVPNTIARATVDDGTWGAIGAPSGREGAAMILDPVANRLILFGGQRLHFGDFTGGAQAGLWSLTLSSPVTWKPLAPGGVAPVPRAYLTAIYDPPRRRMVTFGGTGSNEVWALALDGALAWSSLAPAGTPPPELAAATAVYDPVRERMLVFGGFDGATSRDEVWALTLSGTPTWSLLATAGGPPHTRDGHVAIYDPDGDRMIVYGGADEQYTLYYDVWSLSLSGTPTWSPLTSSGGPPPGPFTATAVHDGARDRMVVFGGTYEYGSNAEAWSLSLTGPPIWTLLTPAGTPPEFRMAHAAVADPSHDRMIVVSGFDGGFTYRKDVVALSYASGGAWSTLLEPPPDARIRHSMIYDSNRDRIVVFGGETFGPVSDAPYALPLTGLTNWERLTPAGTSPGGLSDHSAIYDPVRDRMLVYPGAAGDVWELSFSGGPAWSHIVPSGAVPPPRNGHSAIYDPVRDRMIVFGGVDGSTYRNDAWALSLSGSPAWSQVVPAAGPLPAARTRHTAAYDAVHDRMIVFAGVNTNTLRDVWTLSLSGVVPTWSEVMTTGTPPPAFFGMRGAYDPIRDRLLAYVGSSGSRTHALALAGTPTWTQLAPDGDKPISRCHMTALFDSPRDRMIIFGGFLCGGLEDPWFYDDAWALRFGTPVSVPEPIVPTAIELSAPRPQPARGDVSFDYHLSCAMNAALTIRDVTGRTIATLASGLRSAGKHSVRWNRTTDRGEPARPGVYFAVLNAGASASTRKAVILE